LADPSDRREGRGTAAALHLFALALVCALAWPALSSAGVRGSAFADRATHAFNAHTACYDRPDWAALVDSSYPELKGEESSFYGLSRYDRREVALPARGCGALEGWRRARPHVLAMWIFVLGHELTHVQQTDLEGAPSRRPFDEVAADCGGFAKFEAVRLALGIARRVSPPPRELTWCPAKRERRR
jgi:hypothetical protein